MDIHEINRMIQSIKFEYDSHELLDEAAQLNPFELFSHWFGEALRSRKNYDPCAMVLSTTDENNFPDSRVVLLKKVEHNQLIFYSNYNSKKAEQLDKNNVVAANFYWPDFERQIRIRGRVAKIDRKMSESYFLSRPREAQLSAQAWIQSSIIADRNEIESRIKLVSEKFSGQTIPCPAYWGGYVITLFEYEFFQGRKWRRHDRLLYTLHGTTWDVVRLAP